MLLCLLSVLCAWLAVARADRARLALVASQRASRDQESLLRTLLDESPLAMMMCTENGKIVFENEPARRMFFEGRSAAGMNFLRIVGEGPEPFREALLGANDKIVELSVEGGSETYHFARRTFLHDGEPHTLIVVRPMTREVARRDVEVLKKVVRVISHEVNNSLAPISSLLHTGRQILAAGERLDRLERVFDTVDERAAHLSQFIASYADLCRLPPAVPTRAAWDTFLSRIGALFPEVHVSAPVGAFGFFDPGQLEQALINLLRNAQEAGGPMNETRLSVTLLDGGGAELRVLDRGPGFSPAAMESALLPFFTTKRGGSGVGLALVREVVQGHEGHISLGARDGGGAVVKLWLPGPGHALGDTSRGRLTLTRG